MLQNLSCNQYHYTTNKQINTHFIRNIVYQIHYNLREIWYVNIDRDRLCGLVVRVSGYRYRGLGFDSRRYQIF